MNSAKRFQQMHYENFANQCWLRKNVDKDVFVVVFFSSSHLWSLAHKLTAGAVENKSEATMRERRGGGDSWDVWGPDDQWRQ